MEPQKSGQISTNRARALAVGSLLFSVALPSSSVFATPRAGAPSNLPAVPAGFSAPLPTDGAIALSYTRAPAAIGCTQTTEAEIRDLFAATVHTDPFVPPGKTPAFRIEVELTRPAGAKFRATFSLFDDRNNPRGTSFVEDESCDGAHLKLLASLALLVQPRPDAACDAACREGLVSAAADRAAAAVRAKELPRAREEARAEAAKAFEERRKRDFRAVIGVGIVLGANLAAQPSAGFMLSAEARAERWSLGLEMRSFLPSRGFGEVGAPGLDLALATGAIVPCLRWRVLSGCAVFELGGVFVTGAASTAGAGSSAALLGLGGRARVDLPLAEGFEARLFGDLIGYPAVLSAQGTTAAGEAFAFDAPRRVGGVFGVGLVRSFE